MADRTITLASGDREFAATVRADGRVQIEEAVLTPTDGPDGSVRIGDALAWTAAADSARWVFLDGEVYVFDLARGRPGRRRGGAHHGSLSAPMPATVRRINVAEGDRVTRGQTLVVLEAMKMELPVKAPADGVVERVQCREGQLVQPGVELIGLLERDDEA